jgi:hypothetical protein
MTYAEQVKALQDTVERIVGESGDPTGFSAHQWLNNWISQPVPALDSAYLPMSCGSRAGSSKCKRACCVCKAARIPDRGRTGRSPRTPMKSSSR